MENKKRGGYQQEGDVGEKLLGVLGMIASIIGAIMYFVWSVIWKIVTIIFSFFFNLATDILSGVRGRIVQACSALVFFGLIAYAINSAVR